MRVIIFGEMEELAEITEIVEVDLSVGMGIVMKIELEVIGFKKEAVKMLGLTALQILFAVLVVKFAMILEVVSTIIMVTHQNDNYYLYSKFIYIFLSQFFYYLSIFI